MCAVLGVPVLDSEPFPHVNDAADFGRRQQGQYLRLARALTPALIFAATGGVMALALAMKRDRARRPG